MPLYSKRNYLLTFLVVFFLVLFFAAYTQHAWEDWYITYRISKNLALGNGLVYTIGERVHTFTSPLGVLVPAFFNFITFNFSDDLVLWLFRFLSCGLLATSAVLLLRLAKQFSFQFLAAFFLLTMFALDLKIIDFSTNGMETAFMMIFLVLNIYVLTLSKDNLAFKLGLVWAGLMWTRPDSIVYIACLTISYLIIFPGMPGVNGRKHFLKIILQAFLVMLLFYLPWLIFASLYYGSPIPNSIIAKSISLQKVFGQSGSFFLLPSIYPFAHNNYYLDAVFMPAYYAAGFGSPGEVLWYHLDLYFSRPLVFCSIYYWAFPYGLAMPRAISFALFLLQFYFLFLLPAYPWYHPSFTLLSIIVLGFIVHQFISYIQKKNNGKYGKILLSCFSFLVALCLAVNLFLTMAGAYQLRTQQNLVENKIRKQIGLWLHEQAASSKDTVFLEPLGYIGFYSQLKMLDYPGLSAPEVVAARRKIAFKLNHGSLDSEQQYADLIKILHPTWLVLRPPEVEAISANDSILLNQEYHLVKIFDMSQEIASYRYLPGLNYLLIDGKFLIFHCNSA
jgi:hypothetical protein